MTLFDAAVLGVVQGLTEFLPISSSGHLVLAQHLLGLGGAANVPFDVLLHVATLLAVFWCLRNDLWRMLTRLFSGRDESRLALLVCVATVPTAILGYAFESRIRSAFGHPAVIGAGLLVTGTVLFVAPRVRDPRVALTGIRWWQALVVGVGQGLATVPGVSRSGTTICAGIVTGVEAESAARFSFLLAIPAITGAAALSFRDLNATEHLASGNVVVGMLTAWAAGVLSIRWLLRIARRGRFDIFAVYCWVLGGIVVALTLAQR